MTLLPGRLADATTVEVGQIPSEGVYTENKLELRRYESLTEHQHPVPVRRSRSGRPVEVGHRLLVGDLVEPVVELSDTPEATRRQETDHLVG